MKNIYIDSEFRCYTENPTGEYREFDVPFFHGKCKAFIEGYMYIPYDESMIDKNGVIYHGEMIAPIKNYDIIGTTQTLFEELSPSIAEKDERIAALEEENIMLLECVLEMSEIVYA